MAVCVTCLKIGNEEESLCLAHLVSAEITNCLLFSCQSPVTTLTVLFTKPPAVRIVYEEDSGHWPPIHSL